MASCMHGGSQPKYIFLIKNEFQVAGMEPVMVADPGGGGGGGGGDGGEPPRDGSWITKMLGMASNRGKARASAAADLAGEAKPAIVIADEGALRVGGKGGLAGSGQAEEDGCVAVLANVC